MGVKHKTQKELLREAASAFGRMGGLAISKNRKHMREIGRKGSDKRWGSKKAQKPIVYTA